MIFTRIYLSDKKITSGGSETSRKTVTIARISEKRGKVSAPRAGRAATELRKAAQKRSPEELNKKNDTAIGTVVMSIHNVIGSAASALTPCFILLISQRFVGSVIVLLSFK